MPSFLSEPDAVSIEDTITRQQVLEIVHRETLLGALDLLVTCGYESGNSFAMLYSDFGQVL